MIAAHVGQLVTLDENGVISQGEVQELDQAGTNALVRFPGRPNGELVWCPVRSLED